MRTRSEHERDLHRLCQELKEAAGPVCLQRNTSTSNLTRNTNYKQGHPLLDVSEFRHVLGFEGDVLLCEPHVTMEEMVAAALKEGRVPAMVPEFRGITVGGAVQGAALESSSHRLGQFNDICPFYEVALGTGESLRASPEQGKELYDAIPGSYGSLAVTTLIGVKTVEAKACVQLRRLEFDSREALTDYLTTPNTVEFLEGFALGDGRYIALEGEQTDQGSKVHRIGGPMNRWFIQELLDGRGDMCVPLEDYLFRLDRGAFWMGKYLLHPTLLLSFLFSWKLAGNKLRPLVEAASKKWPSRPFCALFGWAMGSRALYRGLHRMPQKMIEDSFLIQDSFMAPERAAEFIRYGEEVHGITPLWLCPVRKNQRQQLFSPQNIEGGPVLLNVGTYGVSKLKDQTRHLEKMVTELGGRKALYSHSYYTPEEFWELYDEATYRHLRTKFGAEGKFLSIDEKVL